MKLVKKDEFEIKQEQQPLRITAHQEELQEAFGEIEQSTKEREGLAKIILTQTYGTCYSDGTPQEITDDTLGTIKNIKPRDHIESMLIAQIIATHNAAMKSFNTATRYLGSTNIKTLEIGNITLNSANKLTRTYTMQMDALNRYRGKVQQKMTIEHININGGGQAIIGNLASNKKVKA